MSMLPAAASRASTYKYYHSVPIQQPRPASICSRRRSSTWSTWGHRTPRIHRHRSRQATVRVSVLLPSYAALHVCIAPRCEDRDDLVARVDNTILGDALLGVAAGLEVGVEQIVEGREHGLMGRGRHGQLLDEAIGELDQTVAVVGKPQIGIPAPGALRWQDVVRERVEAPARSAPPVPVRRHQGLARHGHCSLVTGDCVPAVTRCQQ